MITLARNRQLPRAVGLIFMLSLLLFAPLTLFKIRYSPLSLYTHTHTHTHIYITLSCHQHGYPWPSFATPHYRSSLLANLQGSIPYPHRAAVCMFELAVLLLFGHTRGSIGVHHLWALSLSLSLTHTHMHTHTHTHTHIYIYIYIYIWCLKIDAAH